MGGAEWMMEERREGGGERRDEWADGLDGDAVGWKRTSRLIRLQGRGRGRAVGEQWALLLWARLVWAGGMLASPTARPPLICARPDSAPVRCSLVALLVDGLRRV